MCAGQAFARSQPVHGIEWTADFQVLAVADEWLKLLQRNLERFEFFAVVVHAGSSTRLGVKR